MDAGTSLLAGLALTLTFIESARLIGFFPDAMQLLQLPARSLWVMQHPHSPDTRKEKLVQAYAMRLTLQTLRVTGKLVLVLTATAVMAMLLSVILYRQPGNLDFLTDWLLLASTAVFGCCYWPLRKRVLNAVKSGGDATS